MKIAIYNGDLKPTTFVLRLVQAVNERNKVYITGTSRKLFKYKKDNILYFPTDSRNKYVLVVQFVFKLLTFLCVYPKKTVCLLRLLRDSDKPLPTKLKQFLIWSKLISNDIEVVHIQWASHIYLFEELLESSYFKIMVSLRGRLINITPLAIADLKTLYEKTFPKIKQFHAVSDDIKKQAMLYGAIDDKIKVIYSGVDIESFAQFKKTDYSRNETLKIISVGRQHWKKGYNYALEAVKIVLDLGVKVNYTLIGAMDSEEIIYTVHDLNMEQNVVLTAKLEYNDVLREMQRADVIILPSVSEGLANVVIEAMAIGLPVISTNVSGMPELVIYGETGLLFENRNVNHLAKIIMDFRSMPEKNVEIMCSNAYQKIIEQHSWQIFRKSFNDFYKC